MIELQFINALLARNNPDEFSFSTLTADFFPDYYKEYTFIKEHYNNFGKLPDLYSFIDKFPDFDIINVSEDSTYLLNKLYEDKNRRFLQDTYNKVRECLLDDRVEDAMTIYTNSKDSLVTSKPMECVDILKDTSRYDAYIERCGDFSKYYVRTGFTELDELIGGWDRQEELVTIAARTNMGKSWILLKCAVAALEQGLNVGVYSGEMSERKVGYRFDTLVGHISNRGIIQGNESLKNDYKKYIDNLPNKYKGSFKILTPAMINGMATVSSLRTFIEKENLDILFIDQHSLLEDERKARNPIDKASNISKDLKNLQVLKKIPIITVSQQNRSSTENGVNTEHIAQSDRIAQDSTIIIFFEQKDGRMTMHLVKSRDSANMKKLNYVVDFDKGIFTYIPEDGDSHSADCENLKEEFCETEEDNF